MSTPPPESLDTLQMLDWLNANFLYLRLTGYWGLWPGNRGAIAWGRKKFYRYTYPAKHIYPWHRSPERRCTKRHLIRLEPKDIPHYAEKFQLHVRERAELFDRLPFFAASLTPLGNHWWLIHSALRIPLHIRMEYRAWEENILLVRTRDIPALLWRHLGATWYDWRIPYRTRGYTRKEEFDEYMHAWLDWHYSKIPLDGEPIPGQSQHFLDPLFDPRNRSAP